MRVVAAEFEQSAADPDSWPKEGAPEIAFAGRSNVGKSTLLQALVGRRGLVRISSTPGRTRLLNFFHVTISVGPDDKREARFVDLPGYGYAKISKAERKDWMARMERYLGARTVLRACVLLIDARRGAELDETEIARWLGERGVKVVPVVTKADKLSKHERRPVADAVRRAIGIAPVIVSATTGEGVD